MSLKGTAACEMQLLLWSHGAVAFACVQLRQLASLSPFPLSLSIPPSLSRTHTHTHTFTVPPDSQKTAHGYRREEIYKLVE